MKYTYVDMRLIYVMSTCNIIMLSNILHVNINILLININKLHVIIIILHVWAEVWYNNIIMSIQNLHSPTQTNGGIYVRSENQANRKKLEHR